MIRVASSKHTTSVAAGSKAASLASYVFVGRIVTFLMTGIALILVTRLLGSSQYGVYTIAVAFAGIFGSIGSSGIGTAMNKFISEYRARKQPDEVSRVVSNSLLMLIVSGVILTALCYVLSSMIANYVYPTSMYGGSMGQTIQLISFYITTSILYGALYDALLGFGNGKHVAIAAFVQSFFQSVVSIALAFQMHTAAAPIEGLVVGSLLGFFAGVYMIFKYNNIKLVMPSFKYMKKLWSFSVPVGSTVILGNLMGSIALIYLGYFVAPSVIGNVGIVGRVSALISVIFDSISFALLPTFSAALVSKGVKDKVGRLYGYAVYLAILMVGPILFYMGIFAQQFTVFLFGSSYLLAPTFISILCLGLLIGIAGSYANTLLIGASKTGFVLKNNIIASFVYLVLTLIFAPKFGALAYILAASLIYPIVMDYLFISKLMKMFKIDLRIGKLSRLVVADVVVSCAVFLLTGSLSGILLLICAGIGFIILYPLVSVLVGGADKADISTIKTLTKGIPAVGLVMRLVVDYAGVALR